MKLSRKCQYALKAVFELAWRNTGKPVKTYSIADAQHMSPRFTEIILNELKHGGYVESRRGNTGGYLLARGAAEITVREVIEYIQGGVFIPAETGGLEAGDADRGKDLFTGGSRLDNGGPACASCHTAAGFQALNGPSWGPDLTDLANRYGGEEAVAAECCVMSG